MKIRQGFVSNSSSSSFVISIKEGINEACPTCGHTVPNFIDHLEKQSDYNFSGDDTCIESNKTELLEKYNNEIKYIEKRVEFLELTDPNNLTNRFGDTTIEQEIEYYKEDKKELIEKINKIQAIKEEVYEISISYHDKLTQDIFDKSIEEGTIVII